MYDTVVVPAATPVATPVVEEIVATEGLLLNQPPPVVAIVKLVVEPTHNVALPVIDGIAPFTVTETILVLLVHP